jgi:aspartyl protease
MAFSLWKCLVLLSFIASVAPEPKVLKMELNRRAKTIHADNIEGRDTGKQYANVLIENSINTNAYFVNASVGTSTPPQVVQLEVDTGSSDIWMIGVGSCDPRTAPCLNSTCKCFCERSGSCASIC